jgi:hypothetical protein
MHPESPVAGRLWDVGEGNGDASAYTSYLTAIVPAFLSRLASNAILPKVVNRLWAAAPKIDLILLRLEHPFANNALVRFVDV